MNVVRKFTKNRPLQGARLVELRRAARLTQAELADLVGDPLQEEGITTVSGWVTQRLGGFPKVGDVLTVGNCEARVEEMEGMRVARLKLTKAAPKV